MYITKIRAKQRGNKKKKNPEIEKNKNSSYSTRKVVPGPPSSA